jgi:hypothetical protein
MINEWELAGETEILVGAPHKYLFVHNVRMISPGIEPWFCPATKISNRIICVTEWTNLGEWNGKSM